ncbi:MAG TPA: hypothetical protein VFX50_18550 [Gemmatimonadales bacterium]|nr:hypothetical protein [Gemmatimonadales bacterium]
MDGGRTAGDAGCGAWRRIARAGARGAALAALLAGAGGAGAAPAAWHCWLHRGEQLACTPVGEPDAGPAVQAAHARPAELLRTIRQRPGALHGQLVYIPMYTVPFDDSPLAQLAEAVLCGAPSPERCTVTLERDPARRDAQARRGSAVPARR